LAADDVESSPTTRSHRMRKLLIQRRLHRTHQLPFCRKFRHGACYLHSAARVRPVVMVQTHAGHLTHANRLTVLLSSEQESWHQTVRRLLEPQGVETLAARSGREALNLVQSREIHVAVLDQSMPQL